MSLFKVNVVARNPKREELATAPVEVLVDVGSELTWLPKDLLVKTGITPRRKRTFTMANKQIIEREVGYAILAAEGYETNDEVVFAEPGDMNLLGVRTLEGFGVNVDNIAHRFVATTTLVAGDSTQQRDSPRAIQGKRKAAPVTETDVSAFLQRPPSEQGRLLGTLRRQRMTGGIRSRDQAAQNDEAGPNTALAALVREKLENLESNPAAFAEFQSSFIKDAIGLDDEKKVSQLREIIQKTYEQAVAKGLDASARPQADVESWALRRDALDRPATRQVEALFTPEERARFGRAFLGVMGIDLGLHDGARHRFVTPEGGVVFPSEQLRVGRRQAQ